MTPRRKSPVEPEYIEPHMCSLDSRLDILSKVPFFASLPAEALREVNSLFRERGFEPGETIFFAGGPVQRLYVVAAGKVKVMRHTFTGHDVLIDILVPGDFFGSLSPHGEDYHPNTAQAQTMACALSIDADEFRQIMAAYPSVAITVLDIVSERLKEAQEMVRQLSAFTAEQRIAFALLKLAEKLGTEQDVGLLIQMPLSREDLAAMTGTTIETASRVVSQLQKEGLIRTGRQWLSILDKEGLAELTEAPQ